MTKSIWRPRGRLVVAIVGFAVLLIATAAIIKFNATPNYRTTYLVDTSLPASDEVDFSSVADAVSSASRNVGDDDALSLRRYGGECDDVGNTAQLIAPGTGRAGEIATAVRALRPQGQSTLLSGVLAAIDDFRARFPLRGRQSNRIIVVTSSGADACTKDPGAVERTIRDHTTAANLALEFRFVGYRVPAKNREALTRVASVTGSPPFFAEEPLDLTTKLTQLTVPETWDVETLVLPKPTPSADWSSVVNRLDPCQVGPARVVSTLTTNITEDETRDPVVEWTCEGELHAGTSVLIFDGESVLTGEPRILGAFPDYRDVKGAQGFGALPDGALIRSASPTPLDGALLIRGIGYIDNAPMASPNMAYELQVRWTAGRFSQSAEKIWVCGPDDSGLEGIGSRSDDEVRAECDRRN